MADLYTTIYSRRDVRSEFIDKPVEDDVLARVLCAAHHAPSVGLSQPWHFIVIDDQATKQTAYELFQEANTEAIELFSPARQTVYASLKLEGILDSRYNICITCDRREASPVLGQTHQADTDLYSTACAVQNLWLAAKAEGLGVGWVSIIDETKLRRLLNIPEDVVPLAYLCVGYVSEFQSTPDLIRKSWAKRRPLTETVSSNRWQTDCDDHFTEALSSAINHRETVLEGDA